MPSDVHDRETRRRNMAAITGRDTKPELIIRKALYARGFRYRLNVRALPGRPDIVLRRYRAVIFVHGCFWHGHDCHLFKWPKTRADFWREKIGRNVERDAETTAALLDEGWRVATVWECALKGKTRIGETETVSRLESWIRSDRQQLTVAGLPD
jgi:DNA mismatch endonuclease (patch repair protein)